MKVAFHTLGCRVNTYDTEAMMELFMADGYDLVDFDQMADVYVINTCTVTNSGDKKSRQLIGRARRLNPKAVICVVGCYAQVASEEVAALQGVSIVLGSRDKSRILALANRSLATGERFIEVSDLKANHDFEDLSVGDYQTKSRAFLKIQDGCNRFCSYCLIPHARGSLSSKAPDKVIKEVRDLVKAGFREVVLSGIHIASYGLEKMGQGLLLDKSMNLIDLLEALEKVEGLERIRIGSIEPGFFKGENLNRLASLKKLCPHFHLSLQSGSAGVLQRMRRRYTPEEYRQTVANLREAIPLVNLTTDVITGFPGETAAEHEETVAFLKAIRLTKTHVFKFSPRQGTPAAAMKDQVAGDIKEARSRELLDLSDAHELAFHQSQVGRVAEVLFEDEKDGYWRGQTDNYLMCLVRSQEDLSGQIRRVNLTEADLMGVYGRLMN